MRILIVDDHNLVRAGLRQIIEKDGQHEVSGEASNGEDALHCLENNCPDVMLLDISMPHVNGLHLLKSVRNTYPELKIIMLSMHADMAYVKTALSLGANGFVVKDSPPAELKMAIDLVFKEQVYLSPSVSNSVVDAWVRKTDNDSMHTSLTPRQHEILELISEGYSTREIADIIKIAVKTVETHKSRIVSTLGLHRNSELLRYAIRYGRENSLISGVKNDTHAA